jgi:hypothetical protein
VVVTNATRSCGTPRRSLRSAPPSEGTRSRPTAPENGRGTLGAAPAAVSAVAVCRSQPLPRLGSCPLDEHGQTPYPAKAAVLRRGEVGPGGVCLALSQPTPSCGSRVVGTGPTCRAFGSARVSPRTRGQREARRLLVAARRNGRLLLSRRGEMGVSPCGAARHVRGRLSEAMLAGWLEGAGRKSN